MTDRRRFWSTASSEVIAQVCADHGARVVPSQTRRMVRPVTDLCAAPAGARDRQMLRGQTFVVRAMTDTGWAFGETGTDGYSGWIETAGLDTYPDAKPSHRVTVRASYAKTTGGLKTPGAVTPLSMGSDVHVRDETDGWSRIAWADGPQTRDLFVPALHLCPIDTQDPDPVTVAERLLGTPYLWGGNSAFGIDCSGLVQIACHACGMACPGDSDQQMAQLGETLDPGTPPQRGDLLFWKGHVGWIADPDTLLHANAYAMSVTREPLQTAIARIAAQGDPVLRHARLTPGKKGV